MKGKTMSRKQTDVEVFCVDCGASLGFVCAEGHKQWVCTACSPTGEPEAVNVKENN